MNFEEAMCLALEQAKKGYEKGEVPVGAILLMDGQIIASAHNQVEELKDASAHAEMLCLRKAVATLGDWRLKGSIIVSTLEPCVMCAGAMILHRVKKIVWAAPDIRHGAQGSWIDLTKLKHPIHNVEMIKGVLQEEAAALMRDFFREKRVEHERRI